MERSATRQQWERDCGNLLRFRLLMRWFALDWILSRRCGEDLGAPFQTWN